MAPIRPWDSGIFLTVNDWSSDTGFLHPFFTDYAKYGIGIFAILLAVGAWMGWRNKSRNQMAVAVWAGVGTLLALAINQPIAHAVKETRPFAALPHVLTLVHRATDYGFPSDHSIVAGAVTAGCFFINRRLGLVALAAATLMCFTRVYVGVHYPTDTVAGAAIGAAVVTLGIVGLRALRSRISPGRVEPV
jgi:undecaprenyl-diphosphatase